MGIASNHHFNPDEPRDASGRWTSNGSPVPVVKSWRDRPLGTLSNMERAMALAAHAYI